MLAINEYRPLGWGQNLYRVGVIRDGCSLLHSLLLETNTSYHSLPVADKKKEVATLYSTLSSSFTLKDFAVAMGQGMVSSSLLSKHKGVTYVVDNIPQLEKEIEAYTYQLETPVLAEVKEMVSSYLSFREWLSRKEEEIGHSLCITLSRLLDIDIYVTTTQEDGEMGYLAHDPSLCYKGRRAVIVHRSKEGNWEAVGQFASGGLMTIFEPDEMVIRGLRKCFEDQWNKKEKL